MFKTLDMELDIKIKDKEFNGKIREIVSIDANNLQEDFVNQPSTYAWFAALLEIATAEYESKKFDLAVLRANLDSEKRAIFSNENKKVTETVIDSAIQVDQKFITASQNLIEISRQCGVLKAVVRALEQRSTMLVQLGAMKRQSAFMEDGFGVDISKVKKANN